MRRRQSIAKNKRVTSIVVAFILAISGSIFIFLALGTNLAGKTIVNPAFAQINFRNGDIAQKAVSLTDKAFSPNPVEVSIETAVIWTNQDAEAHTITSENNTATARDGHLFNSPILSRGMQFNYTFDQAGNFPYYCSLHPNMVGVVSVTEDSGTTAPPLPATKLTVQTDKSTYHVSETVIVSGFAPPEQPVTIKTLNPAGNVYSINEVTASSNGSYSYLIILDGSLTSNNGTYQVIVTSAERQQAETHFLVENFAGQNPKINVTLVNTDSPRFDIDTLRYQEWSLSFV